MLNNFFERSVKFEEEPIPDFELAPGECSSPQPFKDVSDDTCSIFLIKMLLKMIFLHMTNHIGPSGLKKLYKQLGNWQAIPNCLGKRDHKLVRLILQVIVILLRNVTC